ncbi:efflux RND transporter periplasmic adaptor subunit [Mesorhizobium sp. BAC0120]|uniref:efflux RND transporter periplasmic adaptor subunit n=1 Tax=Mesorhizobium sp. BAC0120 TaxID=3090670 RepID=UPI00298BF9BF|nr:efflux RND transporter periplasmic adaptor subunit [Mesorhizobium sp. BAC0120]MDW6020686.1 efflux RND transporter periplasmic adaptor subunit [Mesorhizobium sp. BAC0120]
MRRKIVFSVLVAACVASAGLYFWPEIAGKLEPALSFAQPGAGQRQSDSGPKQPDAGQKKQHASGARTVTVVTATASTADFPIRRYAIGSISSPAVVGISSRISSQIVSIAAKDGQMVKAGDLLFQLDDRALKAQVERDKAALAKDQAMLISAQADLKRAKNLMDRQAGTQQAYDQALANEKAGEANVAADQAQLDVDTVQLGYATITAPISGRLGAISVAVGDLTTNNNASTSTPLVTLTQIDPLRVTFNLPESDFALLQKALASPQPDAVTLHADGDPKPIGKGTLDFLDSSVDTASGTISARATVPNPDLMLWPGQYVDVVLDAGVASQLTSVPTVAVQSGQKGPFVYVVKPDNKVELRQIKVALTVGDNVAVSGGLKSGERVVVEGQTRLTDGTPVRVDAADNAAGTTVAQEGPAGGAPR